MRFNLLSAIAIAISFPANAQLSEMTDIDDLALIYIGAQYRPAWNEDTFKPYVTHTFNDGSKCWLFDGFLMIDFMIYIEQGIGVSLGEYNGAGARRTDWELLLKTQLGIESGNGCHALDRLIGKLIPELGKPGHKHKVVMSLPVAEERSGTNWGLIDGKRMAFEYLDDRVTAMKWHADELIKAWNSQNFENIELDGVYWTKEGFSAVDEQMASQVNDYYHEKGLKTYWIPYFNAPAWNRWKNFGIDVAYLQPNYYFNISTPISQLYQATDNAYDNDMGLEIEFDDNALVSSSTGQRQHFIDYINRFEDESVFNFMPLAYYTGETSVASFKQSTNLNDNELINRLARIINHRHVISGWDKAAAEIDETETNLSEIKATAIAGGIKICNPAQKPVSIFSVDGLLISRSNLPEFSVSCPPGLYIIYSDSKAIKISIII